MKVLAHKSLCLLVKFDCCSCLLFVYIPDYSSLAPDHSLARDLTCARERVWHLESLFLVQMSKFDISNQIRKNAIKLSHDSTSQRRLIVLDLCHF